MKQNQALNIFKRFDQPSEPKIKVDQNFNPFNDETSKYNSKIWNNSNIIYKELGASNLFNPDSLNEVINDEDIKIFKLNSYLVTSTRNSLIIIDRRAHQRIIYEKLMEKITKEDVSPAIDFPSRFCFK